MKISTSILISLLEHQYTFTYQGKVQTALLLEPPLFLSDNASLQANQIYIGGSSILIDKDMGTIPSIYLTASPVPNLYYEVFGTVIEFPKSVDILEIYNYIQNIFRSFNEWDAKLIEASNNDSGIQALIDYGYEVIQNPIIIHTAEFLTIAYSSVIDIHSELAFLLDKELLTEYTAALKMDKEYNEARSINTVSFFPAHITGTRSCFKNIFNHGKYMYRIVVAECIHEFEPSDAALIEHLSRYIQIMLTRDSTTIEGYTLSSTLAHFIFQILNLEITEPVYIEQQFNEFGWLTTHSYFCMKLQVDILDIQNRTISFICKRIENLIKGSCALEFKNSIVVYINLNLFKGNREEVLYTLVDFLRDSYLKAGISNCYNGFSEWAQYFTQAEIALNTGLRNSPEIWIHRFNLITPFYILERCTSQLPAKMVCSQKLLDLAEYDKAHNTQLCYTLKTYLENNLQPVKTSNILFIHRSTFLYRLQKIESIVNLNLDDPDERLYLIISFKLLEQANLNLD